MDIHKLEIESFHIEFPDINSQSLSVYLSVKSGWCVWKSFGSSTRRPMVRFPIPDHRRLWTWLTGFFCTPLRQNLLLFVAYDVAST